MTPTRTLLTAALLVTLIGGGSANVKAQGVTTQMSISCYPSPFVESAMITQGLTERLQGAFDDGDLLLIYRNDSDRFMAAFASPNGYTCILGPGTGLEIEKAKPEEEGS